MAEFPNRMFVVTGDMNDNTDDPPVQVILNGTEPGAEKWVDSLDHLAADDRNTWPANPNHTRYPPEQFDHIIYPQRFDGQVTRHAPLRFNESIDSDTRWVSSAASDHLPVIADLEIKE